MKPCYKCEKRVCAKEGEGVLIVERRERRGVQVHRGTVEEGLHQTLKVVSNGTSVFCKKEGWEEEDGTRLLIPQ